MRIKFIFATVIVAIFFGTAKAESNWQINGSQTLTTIAIDGSKGTVYLSLIINFNQKMNCFPEIGLLLSEDLKLGSPENQYWAKNKMSIIIDSKEAWRERTAVTKYSNGLEFTIIGSEKLLSELQSGNEVKISPPLSNSEYFVFPLYGSNLAIKKVRAACH